MPGIVHLMHDKYVCPCVSLSVLVLVSDCKLRTFPKVSLHEWQSCHLHAFPRRSCAHCPCPEAHARCLWPVWSSLPDSCRRVYRVSRETYCSRVWYKHFAAYERLFLFFSHSDSNFTADTILKLICHHGHLEAPEAPEEPRRTTVAEPESAGQHARIHTHSYKHWTDIGANGRTEKKTERVKDTQTHRHTDTQTHRHTDTQTHRHTDTQTHEWTDT